MNLIDLNALAPQPPRRAIVIGASMAGLLAARVLADHYDSVLILDRDGLPAGNEWRKATPHTRHAHGLLARGLQAMEKLLPGLSAHWAEQGATEGDMQRDVLFYAGHRRFAQTDAGVRGVAASRALLEGGVRRAVLALPRVQACTGVDVRGVASARGRVTGVEVSAIGSAASTWTLTADLVIDASGRGSHMPQWLRAMGFEAPAEERVAVDLRYATAYLRRAPEQAGGHKVVLCAATADCPRPGVLIAQEQDRWVLTLGGYGADAPPLDRAGFIARAEAMAAPEIGAVARAAEFLCEPFGYRFAHSQRRRYEKLARFPRGLLVLGDAVCSFNPIYGQGMSVAACEAAVLSDCLRRGENDLARRFFKRAARAIDIAWTTAVGADLALPCVEGPRPLSTRAINAYVDKVFTAAEHDPRVARAFLDVAHLLAQPPHLMKPATLWRVWQGVRRARALTTRSGAAAFWPAASRRCRATPRARDARRA
jgi:2-polyprenyl-6-methoxyphenol hydroxylase-like FAD-dependent oxidoreductase